jgi:hypothetical protein
VSNYYGLYRRHLLQLVFTICPIFVPCLCDSICYSRMDVVCCLHKVPNWYGRSKPDIMYIAKEAEAKAHIAHTNSSEQGPIYKCIIIALQMGRINESKVPSTTDSVFIRGLNATIKPSDVRDYFVNHAGTCIVNSFKIQGEMLLIALK